jgi:DNA-binding LytR/AlgR family response regulator
MIPGAAKPDFLRVISESRVSLFSETSNRSATKANILFIFEVRGPCVSSLFCKPVTIEKVEAALQKFQKMKAAFEPVQAAKSIDTLVNRLNIAFFYLDKTIVKTTTLNRQQYLITSSPDELERMVDPEIFYRANRQFLINRIAIRNAERFFLRKLT